MKLWLYVVLHNERPMLLYFLKHYAPLCDRIIIYDDHSSDAGPQIALGYMNVEIRAYPGDGLDDMEFVHFAARTYPEARGRADWCIWADADEFIYHPDLRGYLARCKQQGINLPNVRGYAMFSDAFPTTPGQIYDEIRAGVRYVPEDKPVVFQPELTIRWAAGKHTADAEGAVRGGEAEIKLLHYRNLGEQWFIERNNRNYARMTVRNVMARMGWQTFPDNQPGYWEREVAWMRPQLEQVV
jgi:hypothetical protein